LNTIALSVLPFISYCYFVASIELHDWEYSNERNASKRLRNIQRNYKLWWNCWKFEPPNNVLILSRWTLK